MRFGGRALVPLAVLATGWLAAADADAALRYASPTGVSAEPCTAAVPCDIDTAANGAAINDEVIVAPGDYPVTTAIFAVEGVWIHGMAGQPKPRITGTVVPLAGATGPDSRLSDLIIEQAGSGNSALSFRGSGSVAERLEVSSSGLDTCLLGGGSLIRDSICTNSREPTGIGLSVRSLSTSSATARNVTAVASGSNSFGVQALGVDPGSAISLDLRNVIASGVTADVRAQTGDPTGTATIDLANSNYGSITSSGAGTETITAAGSPTNQTDPPTFISAGTGDYRQALGSPTIGSGAIDALTGSLDFEGEARVQGAAIDIGGDEYDATPPDTTIDTGPSGTTDDPTPTFTYSATSAVSFACTLDGVAVACGPGEYTAPALGDGPHTFLVGGRDAFDNLDPTPATRAFTVDTALPDTVPPETTIEKGPRKRTKSTKAKFAFSSDEPGSTFVCKLDRKAFSSCSSPAKLKRLRKGKHVFSVVATDAAGNADASAASYRWKVKKKRKR